MIACGKGCYKQLSAAVSGELGYVLIPVGGYHNRGRPHSSLGPALSGPIISSWTTLASSRYDIQKDHQVAASAVLRGLRHEYLLERIAP